MRCLNPVVPVWKSIAKSAFGRSSRLNRSPACRLVRWRRSRSRATRDSYRSDDAPALVGPSALHPFHGRAGHVRDRHYRARHARRVELVHHGLDRVHGAHLVAVHATDQDAALARLRPFGDRQRHIPVLSGRHPHALKIQKVLLAGFQVVDVELADDLLPLDDFACIDRP